MGIPSCLIIAKLLIEIIATSLIGIIALFLKEIITILLMEIIALFLAVCFGYQLAQAIGDIDQGGSAAVRTLCAQNTPDYNF